MKKKILFYVFAFVIFLSFPRTSMAFGNPFSTENNIFGIDIANFSDLRDSANLVNSSGGDWGYVTIVMSKDNMDKNTWQDFFNECRKLHIIPIIRIATKFDGENWMLPDFSDIDTQINFLNSLNWVVKNRYVIIGNEPNHAKEWGGKVDPDEYGYYLKTYSQRLKNSNTDYFVLPAALDQSASNNYLTMDEERFVRKMVDSHPDIFTFIDGINSHSYPNPDFSGSETDTGRGTINGYVWETTLIKSFGVTKDLPIFITETGWSNENLNEDQIAEKIAYAYQEVWIKDPNIVAVTPFILNYTQDPFNNFSWQREDKTFYKLYDKVKSIPKTKGSPAQEIRGEVLFSFLNPLGIKGSKVRGYFLTTNTGQNIWNSSNVEITNAEDIDFDEVSPFEKKLVAYSVKIPENPGTYDIKIGLYVEGKYIDEIYSGRIVSFDIPIQEEEKPVGFIQMVKNLLKW